MFEDEQVLEWCIENDVNVTQYFFMFLLIEKDFHKPFGQSIAKRYVKKHGAFDSDEVKDLIDRGFVENFNTKGENRPEFYMVRDEVIKMMKVSDDQAEELWNGFPPTFELPGGKNFIARHAGVLGSKENAKKVYLSKIRRSKKKHKFVMEMQSDYLKLVEDSKINSMKLGDWIANEMWDTITKLKEDVEDYGIKVKK